MKHYPFMSIEETGEEITYSSLNENNQVEVYIELPYEDGFKHVKILLPEGKVLDVKGFSDDEVKTRLSKIIRLKNILIELATEKARIEVAKYYQDCIYIEYINDDSNQTIAYSIGDYEGIINSNIKATMHRDYVGFDKYLDEKDGNSLIYFGYISRGCNSILFDGCTDNIKNIVIKNMCGHKIEINDIVISPNEVKVLSKKDLES